MNRDELDKMVNRHLDKSAPLVSEILELTNQMLMRPGVDNLTVAVAMGKISAAVLAAIPHMDVEGVLRWNDVVKDSFEHIRKVEKERGVKITRPVYKDDNSGESGPLN